MRDMYQKPWVNQCPFCSQSPMYPCHCATSMPMNVQELWQMQMQMLQNPSSNQPMITAPSIKLKDYGPEPFVVNIEEATKQNHYYRVALWTGKHLQLTLMSIQPGEDIGLENHPNLDQFIRIEQGRGVVMMGDRKDKLDFQANIKDDYAVIIPAGKWHNLMNTGNVPMKLYSIYAPPKHPYGTVQPTKEDAEANGKK